MSAIKPKIFNLMRTARFWSELQQIRSMSKDWKVILSVKSKGSIQNSQNRPRSTINVCGRRTYMSYKFMWIL